MTETEVIKRTPRGHTVRANPSLIALACRAIRQQRDQQFKVEVVQ